MRLFVSYARDDATTARAVVEDLASLGHAPYFDQDLSGGQRWWDTLLDQVQESGAFLPILSDAYRDSEACRAEATWAESLGIPFLPVTTDQQTPGLYDPVIAEANWITYDPDSRTSLADLARAVASLPAVLPPASSPERPGIPLSYLNTLDRQIRGAAEIGRGDQLVLVSDLRGRLGSRDDATVRALLNTLRERPEITYQAATMIDELLTVSPAPTEPAPRPVTERSVPPPPPPRRATPRAATPQVPTLRVPAVRGWYLSVASAVLVGVALVLILVALANAGWVDHRSHEHEALDDEVAGKSVILPVLVLVIALSAWSVVCQLRRMPRGLRLVGAALGVVLALVVLVYMSTEHEGEVGKGPWLLAAGLLLLAVATLRPGQPAWPSRLSGSSRPTAVAVIGACLGLVAVLVDRLIPGPFFSWPLLVLAGVLAVFAITCQLRQMRPTLRNIAAGLDAVLALVALVLPVYRTDPDGLVRGPGPWLLALALALLAAVTFRPSQPADQITPP